MSFAMYGRQEYLNQRDLCLQMPRHLVNMIRLSQSHSYIFHQSPASRDRLRAKATMLCMKNPELAAVCSDVKLPPPAGFGCLTILTMFCQVVHPLLSCLHDFVLYV